MNYWVDEAVIQSADRCGNRQACLYCKEHTLCRVECCVMHTVYQVKCLDDKPCSYKAVSDGYPICTCPVRRNLFDRYGV